jgi:hypothetical protein
MERPESVSKRSRPVTKTTRPRCHSRVRGLGSAGGRLWGCVGGMGMPVEWGAPPGIDGCPDAGRLLIGVERPDLVEGAKPGPGEAWECLRRVSCVTAVGLTSRESSPGCVGVLPSEHRSRSFFTAKHAKDAKITLLPVLRVLRGEPLGRRRGPRRTGPRAGGQSSLTSLRATRTPPLIIPGRILFHEKDSDPSRPAPTRGYG